MATAKTDIKSPIFIVGLPRSGSTLWAKVLGSHPDCARFPEMHFLTPLRRDFRYLLKHHVGDLSKEQNVEQLLEMMFPKEPDRDLKFGGRVFWQQIRSFEDKGIRQALHDQIIASDDRNIGTIFRIIINEAMRFRGQRRAVVKFPVHPIYLGKLIQWWPESRILHISRDPRALAASKTNDPGGVAKQISQHPSMKLFLQNAGKYYTVFQYIWSSYIHSRYRSLPNYHLFLYEDLVTRPDKVIHQLCDFCELEFTESMLSPPAGQVSSITGERTTRFDPVRANHWRKILSPWESKFIGYVTRPSMRRFGYEPDK